MRAARANSRTAVHNPRAYDRTRGVPPVAVSVQAFLDAVEHNHEAYAREHRVVAVRRIEALAKESLLARNDKSEARPSSR
jgi:cell division septum initiation protein DivIVA